MYKQLINSSGELSTNMVYRIADGAYIPFDPDNTDYQEYLKWVEEGNLPRPADFVEPLPAVSVLPESAE